MFAPECKYRHKKCPCWHKLFRRFKWFRYFCRWCTPIEFKSVRFPIINAKLPLLYLEEIAKIQPMNDSVAAIFYLDVKYKENND